MIVNWNNHLIIIAVEFDFAFSIPYDNILFKLLILKNYFSISEKSIL